LKLRGFETLSVWYERIEEGRKFQIVGAAMWSEREAKDGLV